MTLADVSGCGLMVPSLAGRDSSGAIRELGGVLHGAGRVPDLEELCRVALGREGVSGTDFGEGIAFPHARLEGVRDVALAVGRSGVPLAWGHGQGVWLVFLVAVPMSDAMGYLALVSGLVRLVRDAGLLGRLREAPEAVEMLEVLGRVPLKGR